METVINPMYFYLIGIVDKLIIVGVIGAVLCAVIVCVLLLSFMWDSEIYESTTESMRLSKKYIPKILVCLAIFIAIVLFTPSSNTVIQMAIAKSITIDRVQTVQDIVSKVYTDILNIVNK